MAYLEINYKTSATFSHFTHVHKKSFTENEEKMLPRNLYSKTVIRNTYLVYFQTTMFAHTHTHHLSSKWSHPLAFFIFLIQTPCSVIQVDHLYFTHPRPLSSHLGDLQEIHEVHILKALICFSWSPELLSSEFWVLRYKEEFRIFSMDHH